MNLHSRPFRSTTDTRSPCPNDSNPTQASWSLTPQDLALSETAVTARGAGFLRLGRCFAFALVRTAPAPQPGLGWPSSAVSGTASTLGASTYRCCPGYTTYSASS